MDEDRKNERFVRWQEYRISQLGFSINLFLGFSVASMAFVINLLLGDGKGNTELKCVLVAWAVSSLFGCVSTISRLLDFRYTAQKIRKPTAINGFLAAHLGKVTWGSFWGQIIIYSYGAYVFIWQYVLVQ